jgi:hypothetical protein
MMALMLVVVKVAETVDLMAKRRATTMDVGTVE